MFRSTLLVATVALATAVSAGKAGLAWPWVNEGTSLDAAIFGDGCDGVSHIYNWETWAPSKPGNLNFVGTQRCIDCDSSPINALPERAKQQKWTDLFTLNEPDINGITPTDAATWYKKHINPIKNVNRVTPSITNSVQPNQGHEWLRQFFDACGEQCQHEMINIHWYGDKFEHFKDWVETTHKKFPREYIVISEFALNIYTHDAAAQVAFFKKAIPYLEGLEYVDMYFPFIATSPALWVKARGGKGGSAGTGSCLFNDQNKLGPLGQLLMDL